MPEIIKKIDNAEVIAYVVLNANHLQTEYSRHFRSGELLKTVYGLAICNYSDAAGYYLFYCNSSWETLTDFHHDSIKKAIEQAEFEFQHTENDWIFL